MKINPTIRNHVLKFSYLKYSTYNLFDDFKTLIYDFTFFQHFHFVALKNRRKVTLLYFEEKKEDLFTRFISYINQYNFNNVC